MKKLILSAAITAAALFSTTASAAWIQTGGNRIPVDAVQGGQEAAGALFICRADYKGGKHMGKTRKEFNACNIGWGGREIQIPAYEVLVGKIGMWVPSAGGNLPAGAIQGGNEADGKPLYLCRAKNGRDGGIHPGKIRKEFGACNIGWGGKEVSVRSYEVLVE